MKQASLSNPMMLTAIALFCLATAAEAVSPDSVVLGRQLFERQWPAGNPTLGGDGLGPLFNAQSCVACHHQGGVGGGGDARFNAQTIGIERMKITGANVNNDVIATMLRTFHPGFIDSSGAVSNTVALAHHGGSPMYQSARHEIMAQIDSEFSSEGGPPNASEVRRSLATPILYSHKVGGHEILVHARLFQRNTSPLFGLGLIDEIPGKLLEEQVKLQKKHPEISGRPSTMKDGRYGRFGWRGNVATLLEFVDQACAAEVGLETKRKEQPRDPMNPDYRNPTVDIKDQQIIAMRDFIVALPMPTREIPTSSARRAMAVRGEQVFSSVGCAVCHVPNMGPATGVYSDILLHDMGYESMDLNHAEPYIIRATPTSKITEVETTTRTTGSGMSRGYYGPSSPITVDEVTSGGDGGRSGGPRSNNRSSIRTTRGIFSFSAPTRPAVLMELLPQGQHEFEAETERKTTRSRGRTGEFTVRTKGTYRRSDFIRLHYQPTNFNQEWRTPPLWGLRDSAPYMHDGRAETVLEAIALHDGEAAGTRDRFLQLSLADRHAMLAFLDTLTAPPNAPRIAR